MEENKVEENKIEDKTEKTFKELYLAGEIGFDEIRTVISATGTTVMMNVHWLFIWDLMLMKKMSGSMKVTRLFRKC